MRACAVKWYAMHWTCKVPFWGRTLLSQNSSAVQPAFPPLQQVFSKTQNDHTVKMTTCIYLLTRLKMCAIPDTSKNTHHSISVLPNEMILTGLSHQSPKYTNCTSKMRWFYPTAANLGCIMINMIGLSATDHTDSPCHHGMVRSWVMKGNCECIE